MKGYHDAIEELTAANGDFRRVLYTGKHLQLVLMTLPPGEEIGSEVHDGIDQFFRFEEGAGVVDIDGVGDLRRAPDVQTRWKKEAVRGSQGTADGGQRIRHGCGARLCP